MPKFRVETINAREIAIFLDAMPKALQNKVMRPMVASLCSHGAKVMKQRLKVSLQQAKMHRSRLGRERWTPTGALLASIGVKAPKLMKNGNIWGAFGVRRSHTFAKNKLAKVRKRIAAKTTFGFHVVSRGTIKLAEEKEGAKQQTAALQVRPSRYAHLVERGHGPPIRSRPYPFLQPTVEIMKGVVASRGPSIVKQKWPAVLAAEGRRLGRAINRRTAKSVG